MHDKNVGRMEGAAPSAPGNDCDPAPAGRPSIRAAVSSEELPSLMQPCGFEVRVLSRSAFSTPLITIDTHPHAFAYSCVRTTLEIPVVVFQRVKLLTVQRGISLKDFFNRAVERALDEESRPVRRMSTPPIGRVGEHVVPALSNAQAAALLDTELENKAR